jgi:hypothetical protein
MLRLFHLLGFLAAMQLGATLIRRLYGRVDQVANNLMAVCCNPDSLPPAHQLANHARAGKGLPGARRPLDR